VPENEIEESILNIWMKFLKNDRIGINDNFFSVGGNSLLLVQVHGEIDRLYPGKTTITTLFTYPTVSKLAEYILKDSESKTVSLEDKCVKLPPEFFERNRNTLSEFVSFGFTVDGGVYERLKDISLKTGVQVYDIMLSLFIYLLSETSGENNISVQTMSDDGTKLVPISTDMESVAELADLFAFTGNKRKGSGGYFLDSLLQTKTVREENSIIPLICKGSQIASRDKLAGVFDIIIELNETRNNLSVACEYGSTLKKEKVRELVNTYMNYINLTINEFESSEGDK
jgi:acyl carrier protein